MSQPRTLLDAFERRETPTAARIGFYDRRARTFTDHSQHQFLDQALRLQPGLRAHGVCPGRVVVVAGSDPAQTLRTFLAVLSMGAVPVLISSRPAFDSPAMVVDRLTQTIATVGGSAVVVHDGRDALPDLAGATSITFDEVAGAPGPATIHVPAPESVAYLQLTSGSTSAARAVQLTHQAVVSNTSMLVSRGRLGAGDRLFSWLPLYHDMGLVAFALLPLVHGIDCFFMTPFDFLADPLSLPRAVHDLRASMVSSPNFGYERVLERLDREELEPLDLSCWTRAYCGAEPVDPNLVRRFVTRMAPHGLRAEAFKPSYGLAEATLVVTVPRQDDGPHAFRLSGSPSDSPLTGEVVSLVDTPVSDPDVVEIPALGPPAPGMSVWIEDEEGNRVDDLTPGEVVIWGESVAAGYVRPDGSLDPFTSDGFHTGDLGFLHEGELYVIERLKNIIIRNGVNVATVPMERTLAEVTGVPSSRVLVIDSDLAPGRGRVTAIVELPRKADPDQLVDAVRAGAPRFELPLEQLLLVKWGSLPTTTSGKKQHALVRQRLGADELKVVTRVDLLPPSPDDIVIDLDAVDLRHRVLAVVESLAAERGTRARVSDTASLTYDLGFDSLCLYELAVAIEDALDVRLDEADLPAMDRVGDVIEIVRARSGLPGSGVTDGLLAAQTDLPQLLNVAEAQKDRQVRIEGRWVSDFASCNYLGLDLHPAVIDAIDPMVREWGVHPSWTRAVASPAPYRELEVALAGLVGVPDTVVFPTVTLLHIGVIPRLVDGGGTLLVDREAHHSIHEATELARARGATVVPVDRHDLAGIDAALGAAAPGPKILLVDGVYSMSGNAVDLGALVALAELHDAQVYVDDAHGFGVLGERPTEARPYGHRGNGVVAHLGLGHDRVIYVAGLSKAYSSMAAFVTARTPAERARYELASTLVFSGPIPTASLASALAGLEVNDAEGDELRDRLHHLTSRLVSGARDLGFEVDNVSCLPIVNVIVGAVDAARAACDVLWDHGILITPAVFPAVPLHRSGLRFTVTAANTDEEVTAALRALRAVRDLPGSSTSASVIRARQRA